MALWIFKDYQTEDGSNLIQEWYAKQDAEVQAQFDATLITLAGLEDWTGIKEFKALTRAHAGLGEVRFWVKQNRGWRKFRPVGIWQPEKCEFIFIVGCEKVFRGHYNPMNAFDLALDYKAQLEAGRGSIHEHQ